MEPRREATGSQPHTGNGSWTGSQLQTGSEFLDRKWGVRPEVSSQTGSESQTGSRCQTGSESQTGSRCQTGSESQTGRRFEPEHVLNMWCHTHTHQNRKSRVDSREGTKFPSLRLYRRS